MKRNQAAHDGKAVVVGAMNHDVHKRGLSAVWILILGKFP